MNARVAIAAFAVMLTAAPVSAQDRLRLTGSGASFPAPIYATWFKDFSARNKGITVDYQSKGSGAGVQDFLNKTVDFAGSDSAMKPEDMARVPGGVQLLPITGGEIVLAYNLPGSPKELKLPREVYPQILLGKITRWNDAKLQAANPSIKLPDLPITVVRRADSSGTTYVFTQHISAVSAEWKKDYGFGNTVNWPKSDKFVAAPKNDGVAATIKQTPGAIGYMEWGFAKLSKADTALLQNKAGNYVAGGQGGGAEALASTKLPEDLIAWLPDPDGAKAYPVTSYTWLIFPKKNTDPKKAAAMRQLVEYCLTDGQKLADRMGYIPLPANVVAEVRKAAASIQ
ncbi:MAG TPA: phosphate ABC transporter substrate-binding protein PstS [Burkholderiales bacterium]|nr:phosphate ABC transporter substrate-binding protein PstS [Burkholderiales bacterium]